MNQNDFNISSDNTQLCLDSSYLIEPQVKMEQLNDDVFDCVSSEAMSSFTPSKIRLSTPTKISINTLHLKSPKNEENGGYSRSNSNTRVPVKRPPTFDDENFPAQITPKKWSPYKSPKHHLSSSASKVMKTTNVLREKSTNNHLPRTKSLSTSTPKFVYNEHAKNKRTIDGGDNVFKSGGGTPRKRKKLLKKFQSFSPVSHLQNQFERKLAYTGGVDLIKKNLDFQKPGNKSQRQKTVKDLADVLEEPDLVERRNITSTETDANSWTDLLATTSFASDIKFDSLIHAPIIGDINTSYKTPEKKTPYKRQNYFNSASKTHMMCKSPSLSPLNTDGSLCDIILEEQPYQDLSDPSIHNYFKTLKESFEETSSCDQTNWILKRKSFDGNRTPSKQSGAEVEKNKILHPCLPKTPTKSEGKKLLKRLSTSKALAHLGNKVTRTSYEGIERLNILQHLENEKPPLDIILGYLSGEDLMKACMVSKGWQRIVENNTISREKRKACLRQKQPVKENLDSSIQCILRNKEKRIPFNQTNFLPESINDASSSSSPPRSPSRFNENQKLVKRLKKDAKLTKCPLCGRSCEIISTNNNTTSPSSFEINMSRKPNKSPRKSLFPIQESSIAGPSSHTIQKRKQPPIKASSFPLFGEKNHPLNRSNSVCINNYSKNLFEISSSILGNTAADHDSGVHSESSELLSGSDYSYFGSNSSSAISSIHEQQQQITDYARCTKCDYSFCNKCLNENHPNRDCIIIGCYSPSKEDEKPIKIKGKKSLKRLCY